MTEFIPMKLHAVTLVSDYNFNFKAIYLEEMNEIDLRHKTYTNYKLMSKSKTRNKNNQSANIFKHFAECKLLKTLIFLCRSGTTTFVRQ